MQKNTFGKRGEIIAANYLKKHKYKIIATNYKNKIGEIDIIAKYKKIIVFVEVKTRMSEAFGNPLEAIDERKQHKIHQVATLYLKENDLLDSLYRFDAISVLGDDDTDICHIENAF